MDKIPYIGTGINQTVIITVIQIDQDNFILKCLKYDIGAVYLEIFCLRLMEEDIPAELEKIP